MTTNFSLANSIAKATMSAECPQRESMGHDGINYML